jgi:peroxiredoxin
VNFFWISCIVILWVVVVFLAFLLLGTLRSLGLLGWRLEQLEATTPKRLGRDGLKPGKRAPDFTLPCVNSYVVARSPDRATAPTVGFHDDAARLAEWSGRETAPQRIGTEVSLHDLAGRKVLLVFTQSGCGPCRTVIPELNRLERGDTQVLVINNGDVDATRRWSVEVGARFPVLAQGKFSISKKYEVFATPFAFLIDEKGIIASKGIINNRQHIRYVLSGVRPSEPGALATGDSDESNGHPDSEESESDKAESAESVNSLSPKEVNHV